MEGSSQAEPTTALEAHYQFLLWLIPTLEKFPRNQKFLLGDRIQSTALTVLETLITATYTRARKTLLASANLAVEKLRYLLRLCLDLGHLSVRRFEHAIRLLAAVGGRIGAWLKSDATANATASARARHDPSAA